MYFSNIVIGLLTAQALSKGSQPGAAVGKYAVGLLSTSRLFHSSNYLHRP